MKKKPKNAVPPTRFLLACKTEVCEFTGQSSPGESRQEASERLSYHYGKSFVSETVNVSNKPKPETYS